MANDGGIGDWLGKLGLGSAAMAVLTWAAQVDLWILPLVAWLLALLMRVRGTHFAHWPALNTHVDDLTKSGDLQAAFPGSGAQRRLRVLFAARGRGSRVAAAAQAMERGLAKWFGDEVLSPTAFDRSLTLAVLYPIVLLLLVWVWTGHGYLGATEVLPATWTFLQRLGLGLGLLTEFSILILLLGSAFQSLGWRAWLYVGLALGAFSIFSVLGGAGLFAGTVAITLTSMLSAGVAFTVATVVAVVFCFAFEFSSLMVPAACACAAVLSSSQKHAAEWLRRDSPVRAVLWMLASWLSVLALAAWWIPIRTDPRLLWSTGPAFLLIFFIAVVPVWNAALDLASVALTRVFLRRYLRHGDGWWWMLAADLLLAVALTVLLFWGVLAGLLLMQHWGWGVDAQALVAQFRDNPTDPQVSWLTWMALTNVLPTLAHLGLAFFGLATGWIYRDEVFANELQLKREAPPASPIVGVKVAPPTSEERLLLKAPLSKTQATKLVNWVYVDVWLVSLLPLVLALSAWPAWRWLMRQAMDWLPV